MTRTLSLAALLLMLPATLQAQEAIERYELRSYTSGAQAPLQTTNIPATEVQCNQVPPSPGTSTVNPTKATWDDPATQGRVCVWTDAGGGPLFSLPNGTYEGSLVAINAGGSSPESNRAPFSRLSPPAARTGFRLTR
jgi:hypothetical protein